MEKSSSTLLVKPKSMNELMAVINKYPNAQLFAGGTYIMSRMGYYPNMTHKEIISLEGIPELNRVLHVDRFVEVGSMVTIQQLLNSSANLFSKALYSAINDIATSVIRKQISIGGSLCTSGTRFTLPCILSTVNAEAEIKTNHQGKKSLFKRTSDPWIPISKLYDADGNFLYEGKGFLSRVRIPAEQNSVQIFRSVGNPMKEPASSVILSLTYNISQGLLATPSLCVVLPKGGFFYSQSFNNILSKVVFPISTKAMSQLAQDFEKQLTELCANISEIQKERAYRLFLNTLYQANSNYLSN